MVHPLSTLLPLLLVGTTLSTASPVRINGQTPSPLTDSNGSIDHELVQREFKQSIERSFKSLQSQNNIERRSEEEKEDCPLRKRSSSGKKSKRSNPTIPLVSNGLAVIAELNVGTPAQKVAVIVDTGSADVLVPEEGEGCENTVPCFDSSRSRTFGGSQEETVFAYGQGGIPGRQVSDKIQFGYQTFIRQPFGLISSATAKAYFGQPLGILGLAFNSISKFPNSPTLFDRMIREKSLTQNLFGLYVTQGVGSGSELILGAVDGERFEGETSTLPVVSKTYWSLLMDQFTVNGETGSSGPVFSVIDSGSTSTIIPKAATEAYFAQVPGSFADPNINATTTIQGQEIVGQIYGYPCNASLPTPAFSFYGGGGRQFEIDPKNLSGGLDDVDETICYSNLVGADVIFNGQKAALIGLNFLRSWYSTFNFDDATISFAPAKH